MGRRVVLELMQRDVELKEAVDRWQERMTGVR